MKKVIFFFAATVIATFSAFSPDSDRMVTICHIPPGNTDHPVRITIALSALETHLMHGDTGADDCPCKEKKNEAYDNYRP